MTTVKVIVRKTKGGPGSGHWGHSGLPGTVGGSTPGGGSAPSGGSTSTSHITAGRVTGPADVLEKVQNPSHPMYSAYARGNVNFESETQARVNVGSGIKRRGQYLLTQEGKKFQVNGNPIGTKRLLKKYNSVPEALEAIEQHFAGATYKTIASGSPEWFKKYPETARLIDHHSKF